MDCSQIFEKRKQHDNKSLHNTTSWTNQSWKKYEQLQQPYYHPSEEEKLNSILLELSNQTNLICENEINQLKSDLKKVNDNKSFILQIGDCAELFSEADEKTVHDKCKFYLELGKHLEKLLQKEIIVIGRIAGQYAKPRTTDFELKNNQYLPCYRGDMINSFVFTEEARTHKPELLLQAFNCAQKTIKHMKNYCEQELQTIYSSHEALILNYESALTKYSEEFKCYYNTSAHTIWLGERTRLLKGAHVEFLRGISNPIGIKVGPETEPHELATLIKTLNPHFDQNKIMLLTRLGFERVREALPKLIELIQEENLPVLWCVDPMHGNTIKYESGYKTRLIVHILEELRITIQTHKMLGSFLNGIHLESSFENVAECFYTKKDCKNIQPNNYKTKCDPRLNPEQSFFLLDELFTFERKKSLCIL